MLIMSTFTSMSPTNTRFISASNTSFKSLPLIGQGKSSFREMRPLDCKLFAANSSRVLFSGIIDAQRQYRSSALRLAPSAKRWSCRMVLVNLLFLLLGSTFHNGCRPLTRLLFKEACIMFHSALYLLYPANTSSPPSPERATVTCLRVYLLKIKVGMEEESAKGSSM